MLKDLKAKCLEHMMSRCNCQGCPQMEQCDVFQEIRWIIIGYTSAELQPWQLSDHFVVRFDELIAKLGGEV